MEDKEPNTIQLSICFICGKYGHEFDCGRHEYSLETLEFIIKSRLRHGWLYDYSSTIYTGSKNYINVICLKHGIFTVQATRHSCGSICFKCGQLVPTTEEFIEAARRVHGEKYDYSHVEYINSYTKVKIVCHTHGPFYQDPHSHVTDKKGCPDCGKLSRRKANTKTTESFIKRSIQKHGSRYDYSKTVYTHVDNKVLIICKLHGDFWQKAASHLRGKGCPKCANSKAETTLRVFCENNDIKSTSEQTFSDCRDKGLLRFDRFFQDYNLLVEVHGLQHFSNNTHYMHKRPFDDQHRRDLIKLKYAFQNNFSFIAISYKVPFADFPKILTKCIETVKRGERIFRL